VRDAETVQTTGVDRSLADHILLMLAKRLCLFRDVEKTFIMVGKSRSGTQPFETDRFGVRIEGDGTWTVFDIFTGWPADYVGRFLDGLDKGVADSLCAVVNALDKRHRATPRR